MKFCDICGNLLIAQKKDGKSGWYCRNCKKFFPDETAKKTVISERLKQEEEIVKVFKEDDDYIQYPVADAHCGKCGNNKAYWVLQQTRGADEPQTKFFCCTKCKHKWREY
ncbi:MAG: transcription factor S [Candidatus Aenigmatarchaeota archaeon]